MEREDSKHITSFMWAAGPQGTLRQISILFILMVSLLSCTSDPAVEKSGDVVVDDRALTISGSRSINGVSFQQHPVITHKGYQYVGYYNDERHVCVARRRLPEARWEVLEMKDYHFASNDRHNVISVGICANDGTIHLAFDHHNDTLHYRVSKAGVASSPDAVAWEANLFGPVIPSLEEGNIIVMTYPRFWQTPDGGLQFCYRRGKAGNGDRMIVDYNAETKRWENTRQIDSREGMFEDDIGKSDRRCSYPNGFDYGPDGKLYTTWVWREPGVRNHDLMYAYSPDQGKTWFNNDGKSSGKPMDLHTPGLKVVDIPRNMGLTNTNGQAIDSQGRVHVILAHGNDETLKKARQENDNERAALMQARRYQHYWRDDAARWHHRELPLVAGNRPKILMDKHDNAFVIYGALQSTSGEGGATAIETGDLVIMAASAKSTWTDWEVVHVERGPFVNEMLADVYRWKDDGVLSIMVQGSPSIEHEATVLRILDFEVR